jgi:arylsulfatase A-like enzyme
MDKFCRQGAITFQNACCAGPVSGPSRSALLSGFMPSRSGVYGNTQNMRRSPLVQTHTTLPEYFAKNGYDTISRGKIFHKHATPQGMDEGQWAFTDWSDTNGRGGVDQQHLYSRLKNTYDGQKGDPWKDDDRPTNRGDGEENVDFTWGPTREQKESMMDYRTAQWAAGVISKTHDKPYFLAVGISKPHLPWYVPQEYFDRHPLDTINIPAYRSDDLDDILTPGGKRKFAPAADFRWVTSGMGQRENLFKRAVQAYLAAASFADDCVGVILDALEKGPGRDNTIVIIFGDHGWHLGEKLRFRKSTLWQEATRMPLIIRAPGFSKERADCMRVVSLMDLYPTLADLCGLPPKPEIDGHSIAPLLRDPNQAWDHPGVTVNGYKNACVRNERWYLIRYADDTEEFYDMQADPMQWTNLAKSKSPDVLAAKANLAKSLPKEFAQKIHADLPRKQVDKNAPPLPDANTKRDLSKLR